MGGSSKPPQKTDEERKAERRQLELMEEQAELAKKPIEMPNIPKEKPKPALPPPPPPAQSSADVAQAEEDEKRRAKRRTNTARGTLFAGETGGYRAGALGGNQTLLGGN